MAKWQEIKYSNYGQPYVMHYGRRYLLSDFVRGSDGRGYLGLTNSFGLIIEIANNGYQARISASRIKE